MYGSDVFIKITAGPLKYRKTTLQTFHSAFNQFVLNLLWWKGRVFQVNDMYFYTEFTGTYRNTETNV